MTKTIRVIRTSEVEVEAEYGDTQESLEAKGLKGMKKDTPYVEVSILLD